MSAGWARAFRDDGFVVVPGLLSAAESEEYVRLLERLSGRDRKSFETRRGRGLVAGVSRAWTLPDGVSRTPDCWPVIFHDGLLQAVREVIGPEARYLQHADLHVGFSVRTWHRDSVNRSYGIGPDWDETEPYRLVRVGLYLQGFPDSLSSLRLIPGSHRRGGRLSAGERLLMERRTTPLRQLASAVAGHDSLAARAHVVPTEPGDAILFDPRILHSGSGIRGPKYSMFLAYGVPGGHFTRHRDYYRRLRPELGHRDLDEERNRNVETSGDTKDAWAPSRRRTLLARRIR